MGYCNMCYNMFNRRLKMIKGITGLWKRKSKNGLTYFGSGKLSKEKRDMLKQQLDTEEEVEFLLFPVDKKSKTNKNTPDVNLNIVELVPFNKEGE